MTNNALEDNLLLSRIKNSETPAFDQLFLKYHPNLLRFSRSLLPYPSDAAEDLVIEVFHKLWQDRSSIIIHSSLSALLYKCVKNRVYDHYRKHKMAVLTTLEEMPEDLDLHYASPDQVFDYKELAQNLERLIKKLPEKMQVIFRMSREDNLSYQEIADLLEISLNSVKTQMYRAVKYLKESYRLDNMAF
ncbi:RNA polymerase sigma-70 factor [Pedobacter sp. MC2016-15]|uniref:RNA polymerase sigma factor n=1 Tax=Pedobacter sp. MC2016-15 TaxID=2994473 RepID=UPI002246D03A|nr:RNA polymerase sigma-70 factor [Pedobacter sp. MC2016-15]MCX2479066.1 RNA polymerase sigma-70 factor [Pedobacter sp. MC2016-15]